MRSDRCRRTRSSVAERLFAVPLDVAVGVAVGVRILVAIVVPIVVLRNAFVYPGLVALIEVLALVAAASRSAVAGVVAIVAVHLLHPLLLLRHRLWMRFFDVALFVADRLLGSSERSFGRLFGVEDDETEFSPPIALTVEGQLDSLDVSEL